MSSGRHSAKFEFFLKKILCRVPWSWHSAKPENGFSSTHFPALPSDVTMAHGNGSFVEYNTRQSDPKRQFLIFFLHSIMTNQFIQTYITYISHPSHIYRIHPHIHPPISHPSQYIMISAQVHPNKSTSPSKSTSASQVYHKSITK